MALLCHLTCLYWLHGGFDKVLYANVVFIHLQLFSDLSKILGCLIGLNDEVTAITIVTLGTSLIDVFATR